MTKKLAALEIHYLIKEFKTLIDAKVDKIYAPRKKELFLRLHVPNKGKHILKIDEKSIYLTESRPKASSPSDFCMYLRKKLENARLRKINQIRFERIVSLTFETKTQKFHLIAELFSRGNIILVKDKKILVAAEYQKWKTRTVRPRAIYKHPKKEYNFLTLKKEDFKNLLSSTNKESIVKSLAVDLGLGGTYSEEACGLSKIDKDKDPKKLDDKEFSTLFSELTEIKDKKLDPRIVSKKEKIIDLVPFKLEIYKDFKQKKADSYSNILSRYFLKIRSQVQKQKKQKKLNQIKEIIKDQEQSITNLKKQEKINKEKAEKIYENYQKISGLLEELKKISKKHSWDEIKEKLKGHKLIKEVIPEEKSVVIDIK
ncbi:hypothetical protein GF361_05550 [Candidatus Woesearchaeota archaeon]|nr:hypothetical protein [Candidatus Woesearchaeota archaeon]